METSVVFYTTADRAGYLICRAWCKMKMQDSMSQKQEKKLLLSTKVAFFSFLVQFSVGHGVVFFSFPIQIFSK